MGTFLTANDLQKLAPSVTDDQADVYIADVEALALSEAPCIAQLANDTAKKALVVAILRQAALRWHRAGEGGISSKQLTATSFSTTETFDTRGNGGGRLYPSEVRALRRICRGDGAGTERVAFSVRRR